MMFLCEFEFCLYKCLRLNFNQSYSCQILFRKLVNVPYVVRHLVFTQATCPVNVSHQPSRMLLNRVRSLPLEIQKVTSLRRLPCKHHWPPASHKIMRYWQCNHLTATTSNDLTSNKLEHYELFFPSSKFIKGNEVKRLKLSSPKRYLLRDEQKKLSS